MAPPRLGLCGVVLPTAVCALLPEAEGQGGRARDIQAPG